MNTVNASQLVSLYNQDDYPSRKLAEKAEAVIYSLLITQHVCRVSFSGGKDSSVVMALTLNAALKAVQAGHNIQPIHVSNSDTGIENPVVHAHVCTELDKVKLFCDTHGIEVNIQIAKPHLSSSWAFRHIGSGKLVTYPMSGSKSKNGKGQSRDCSVMFKVQPLTRLSNQIVKDVRSKGLTLVTLLGTRFDESSTRADNMTDRGESDTQIWQGANGHNYLSPIANWTTQDVWGLLTAVLERKVKSYSDFENCFKVYEDAVGTTCAVDADMALGKTANSRGCGARHGCSLCTVVSDKSMANMIENDKEYAFMRGLNDLQQYLLNTQWDWSLRSWVGRTINNGYVTLGPDTYSAEMVENLLKFALTIDVKELQASEALGIAPRFQLIDMEMLIAIDAEWSRHGLHVPHHALYLYREVYHNGKRFDVPRIEPVERTPKPANRYYFVGNDWDEGHEWAFSGLANATLMSLEGCPASDTISLDATDNADAITLSKVNTDSVFSIDKEAADNLLGFELDHLLDTYHNDRYIPTAGYHNYITYGTLTLSTRQLRSTDTILRRTAFRHRHGLSGQCNNIDHLIDKSIDEKTMRQIRKEAAESMVSIQIDDTNTNPISTDEHLQMDLFQ